MTPGAAGAAQCRSATVEPERVIDNHKQRLDRQLDRWQDRFPPWAARVMAWLRKPSSRWVRIPIGLLLVVCGLVGFLPVVGFWMIAPGLLLLAIDVAFLRGPVRMAIVSFRRMLRRWRRHRKTGGQRY